MMGEGYALDGLALDAIDELAVDVETGAEGGLALPDAVLLFSKVVFEGVNHGECRVSGCR